MSSNGKGRDVVGYRLLKYVWFLHVQRMRVLHSQDPVGCTLLLCQTFSHVRFGISVVAKSASATILQLSGVVFIELIHYFPRRFDDSNTSRRVRMTIYGNWIILHWQLHRTPIRRNDRLRLKLLCDMFPDTL